MISKRNSRHHLLQRTTLPPATTIRAIEKPFRVSNKEKKTYHHSYRTCTLAPNNLYKQIPTARTQQKQSITQQTIAKIKSAHWTNMLDAMIL